MNTRSPGPLSDVVRSSPHAVHPSTTSQDNTSQDNPPTPASGGARFRADRARNGSRRRRDLDALATERLQLAPEGIVESDDALAVWALCCALIEATIAGSWFGHYVPQMRCLGAGVGCVCVEGPPVAARRLRAVYGRALGELVREESDFRGIFIYDAPGGRR